MLYHRVNYFSVHDRNGLLTLNAEETDRAALGCGSRLISCLSYCQGRAKKDKDLKLPDMAQNYNETIYTKTDPPALI
jgi:hypothetical protein